MKFNSNDPKFTSNVYSDDSPIYEKEFQNIIKGSYKDLGSFDKKKFFEPPYNKSSSRKRSFNQA